MWAKYIFYYNIFNKEQIIFGKGLFYLFNKIKTMTIVKSMNNKKVFKSTCLRPQYKTAWIQNGVIQGTKKINKCISSLEYRYKNKYKK